MYSEDEAIPQPRTKGKKNARKPLKKAKARIRKPLKQISNNNKDSSEETAAESDESEDTDRIQSKNASQKQTIEQIYQKKTQLQHILLRPDTYVGSIDPVTQNMWIYDEEASKMHLKKITFVPGLYKIFDEIIVNACDNKQRDASMNTLRVTIDPTAGEISVWNNGKGIPVVQHKEHEVYVPELIFGHLLTGSNFDDKKKKTTGGRNGYGAKLANIFSTKFIVETADKNVKKRYKQVFSDNMSQKESPAITSWNKQDFTCITFRPDLKRFKMDRLDDDIVSLFKKRVFDIAGVTDKSLQVYLNEEKITCKSFPDYISLYTGESAKEDVIFDKPTERWQVGFGPSDDGFQQISFVNGICTTRGGQHVTYIADQVVNKLVAAVKKRNKGEAVKPNYIKNMMTIYVSALIDNPAFDSQTKETLTTRPSSFGSTHSLSDKFLKQIEKSGIVERVVSFAKFKQTAELQRKGAKGGNRSKLTGITKLDDANYAGTAEGRKCTLILTEGDSAKSLTIGGLSVVGRDYYGVFPLKGKLLNVREASHSQILKNEEIQNVVKILGLKYGQVYESTKSLRYGHLMIMADQDHDGSHIKGLVINFIHHFWPSLLQVEGFMHEFITPIVKCAKGSKKEVFYTMPEYEAWRLATNNGQGWRIKYYKGLGTSTTEEAKEYFSDLATHQIDFSYKGEEDGDSIDMAFSKKRVEERKNWLRGYTPGTHVDYNIADMPYSEFVNKELILFSRADNMRSIPCLVDGFKPSQRKVLYCCFKRNLRVEIKVAQLAGYVSEHSSYHHGEASLHGTIINMAQDFIGSNNSNLLSPNGQFGTRILGGKDAASPRYIFTKLEAIAYKFFDPNDNSLLNYLDEDGQLIEPEWYVPVIPMVLVNGSEGIGTGWSSFIPNYNPLDLIENLRARIKGEAPTKPLVPWYRGFTGSIEERSGTRDGDSQAFVVRGIFHVEDDSTLVITELPVKTWTHTYKQFLESLMENDTIKDFKENHTDSKVLFTISMTPEKMQEIVLSPGGIMRKFKLESSISAANMHLFDADGRIQKYDSPHEIISAFYDIRLAYYGKRKAAMLQKLTDQIEMLANKVKFILAVIQGDLIVSNRKKVELLHELVEMGYDKLYPNNSKGKNSDEDEEKDDQEGDEEEGDLTKGYNYLLSMKIWSLTKERVDKLRAELKEREVEYKSLEAKSIEELWLTDLDTLEELLHETEETRQRINAQSIATVQNGSKKRQRKQIPRKKAIKEDDSEYKEDKVKRVVKRMALPKESKGKNASTSLKQTKITAMKNSDPLESVSLAERIARRARNQTAAESSVKSENDEAIPLKKESMARPVLNQTAESSVQSEIDEAVPLKEEKTARRARNQTAAGSSVQSEAVPLKDEQMESDEDDVFILEAAPTKRKAPAKRKSNAISQLKKEKQENDVESKPKTKRSLRRVDKPVKRQKQIVGSEEESQDDMKTETVRRGTRNRNPIRYQSMLSDLSETEASETQERKGTDDSNFPYINIDSD
uniref:DNA topoisomerase 2 n=1 Tax=Albugo laibachii Nc14 TaxID=890382 RepID=F0WKX4_9STRA|nr:predicted protein putative [Albugo laibachii Nc14]CCA24783.1 topoisomerase putative [Albugo laibachii Nc14]|eukprot:CCA24783.1 topoisomerase putative [Albugo laibachii Nc14]